MQWLSSRTIYDNKEGQGGKQVQTLQGESDVEYQRISGTDIAGNPKERIAEMVDLFYSLDISPHMLKEFDNFEETFIAIMVLKFHMMVGKQKDYGPGNISKGGMRGLVTRLTDKVERVKTLVGDSDTQVEQVKSLLATLPDDPTSRELDEFAQSVNKVVNPTNAVADESIEDTLMDAGNYGDIGYAFLHHAWGKPLRDK